MDLVVHYSIAESSSPAILRCLLDDYHDEGTYKKMEQVNANLLRHSQRIRVLGATGLEIAHVACGRLSAHLHGCIKYWDFASSRIILEEAGGIFDLQNISGDKWEILASAPGLYSRIKELSGF